MSGPSAAKTRCAPRTVSHRHDPAEVQADRAADAVARGGSVAGWSLTRASLTAGVHREEAKKPSDDEKLKEAAKKTAEAALQTEAGAALRERVLTDPLVKAATGFLETAPGKVVAGGAAAAGVTALAATGQPLPFQAPAIPLDRITPGLSAEVKVEGPLNAPTFVGLSLTFTEQGAGRKGPTSKDRIAADTARLRAQQQSMVPQAEEDRQRAEEQSAAVAYMLAQQRARFSSSTLIPLLPATKPKTVEAPAAPTETEKKDDAEPPVQRKPATARTDGPRLDTSGVDDAVGDTGQALDPAVRHSMEARFGQDFSHVRLHAGTTATHAAEGVDASAFTVGDDIAFAGGFPDAATYAGRHLLAHELAHFVQQRSAELDLHDPGVDPAAARSERGARGEPPRPDRCYTVAAGCFEEGVRCWAVVSGVLETIEGMLPAAPDGTLPHAPDLCEQGLQLDLAFDELILSGGELVYPERGLAVRMNPENGILLGLVGFAPTTAENYRRLLRPVAEIPRPLTMRKTR